MTDRIHWAVRVERVEPRPNIACPLCAYVPHIGELWSCTPDGCGGSFDTFATRAKCPHCQAQFAWTACPQCSKVSAHRAWYRTPAIGS
jgi:hypothetical protein